MAPSWVDEGLRRTRERDEQQRLASERRHHHTSVIKEQGPSLMDAVVGEVRAVIDEYHRKVDAAGHQVEFEALPRGGFCVTRSILPRVGLECRPDYDAHALYCNMTRTEEQDSETVESVFNLNFFVDESNRVGLRHGTDLFHGVEQVAEFLLKPVLFPLVSQHP